MTGDEAISIHHQEGWPIDDQRIEQFMRYDYQQVRGLAYYSAAYTKAMGCEKQIKESQVA